MKVQIPLSNTYFSSLKSLPETFQVRQDRATLRNFVKRASEAFTGMIYRKPMEVSNYGPMVTKSFKKIDTQNDLTKFAKDLTVSTTKASKAYILIDSPADGSSAPYFVLVHRSQLINWRKDSEGNFTMIVIEEVVAEEKGLFGVEYIMQWRHYDADGNVTIYRRTKDKKEQTGSNTTGVVNNDDSIADGYYIHAPLVETDYDGIPFVEISIGDEPILYDIAQMNIKHYNRQSHKDRYLTMAALPIPVIWGADLDDSGTPTTAQPALVIGVDEAFIFTGTKQESDFEWRELSGDSLDQLEKDLDSIVEDITTGILRASETANAVQKTATEVQLLQAEASNRTSTLATAVETGLKEALEILAKFNNEKVPKNAVLLLNKDFNSSLMGSDGARILVENYMMGLLSMETLLTSLSEMELINIDSATNEIERIGKDKFMPVPKGEPSKSR